LVRARAVLFSSPPAKADPQWMKRMGRKRALIVGGSLAGLFAAHLLRAIGWEVAVFERTPGDLAGRGAGIGTHDALIEVVQRIGLTLDSTMGVAIQAYACLDRDGHVLHEMPLRRMMSAWGVIYRPLKDRLPAQFYHSGCALARVEANAVDVTAILADGSRVTGDLLIAADGFRSTVREQFLPRLQPTYAGYVAWRAVIPEAEIAPALRGAIFDRITFCVPNGELTVSYPVPARDGDAREGHRAYNIVWYRPADFDALVDLCTDVEGRQHEISSIPPALIRPQILTETKAASSALLAPPVATVFSLARSPFFHPIYELTSPQLVFGRVVLLGDAAFVARPHVGAGVTKAALDAACLADAIAADNNLDQALAHYDLERRRFGEWFVARGREMGAWIRKHAATDRVDPEPDRQREVVRQYASTVLDIKNLFVDRATVN
jgi:2-polyprenyl-6-methoxyphenol hydroxylase-like FAD-dependent oxidoreductase